MDKSSNKMNLIKWIKSFCRKYPHIWTLSYAFLYLPWFIWLESRANQPYHVIHFILDDYIPFNEWFIIPYFMWFVYVAGIMAWLFFHDVAYYYKNVAFLYSGMTLFLIISTVYPNGHLLRPASFTRDNIAILMVRFLYFADTSTDIFPSIHVYNSIATHMAVCHCPKLRQKKWLYYTSAILMVLIILSTVFLKQHSSLDVIGGILLGIIVNRMVYAPKRSEKT